MQTRITDGSLVYDIGHVDAPISQSPNGGLLVTSVGGVSKGVSLTLLSAASATGAGQTWAGGDATFAVFGTFGGATVTLQVSPDAGTTWIDVNGTAQTTNGGAGPVSIPAGYRVRAAVTGGAGTSVTALLTGL